MHEKGVDTTTPAGRAMFRMCGVFAEFERSMIQARVKAGLERAKASDKTLGRAKTPPNIERRVQRLLRDKVGKKSIARQLGIGVSVVQRIAAIAADEEGPPSNDLLLRQKYPSDQGRGYNGPGLLLSA